MHYICIWLHAAFNCICRYSVAFWSNLRPDAFERIRFSFKNAAECGPDAYEYECERLVQKTVMGMRRNVIIMQQYAARCSSARAANMHQHAATCISMQQHALACSIMQHHVAWCTTMQTNAATCWTPYHAVATCSRMQQHAASCGKMRLNANRGDTCKSRRHMHKNAEKCYTWLLMHKNVTHA